MTTPRAAAAYRDPVKSAGTEAITMRQSTGRSAGNGTMREPGDGGAASPEQAGRLLRAYHRQVEEWFVEFAQARSRQRQRERALSLAQQRGAACGEQGA
jgi:hypothetical protein